MPAKGLGRVDPPDLRHLELWPATPIIEQLPPVPPGAMRRWETPERYDQGSTPRCVDFGTCTMMSAYHLANTGSRIRYQPGYLYRWAVRHDGIEGDPGGTTSRAGLDYTRRLGLVPARRRDPRNRILTYRWCRDITELAAALYHIGPVPIGINWYAGMSDPDANLEMRRAGPLEGGHYIVLDQLDMARGIAWATQTWGLGWPEAYTSPDTAGRAFFTLETLDRVVFSEGGEAGIITDRLEHTLASPGRG
jgi:hypothetical protein